MDTIHHLLRLNVEIEGALRVLADRDNEIAMRILDEKTRELAEIVSYLAHPEEISATGNQSIKESSVVSPVFVEKIAEVSTQEGGKNDENEQSLQIIRITDEDLTSESSSADPITNSIKLDSDMNTTTVQSDRPSTPPVPVPSKLYSGEAIKDNNEEHGSVMETSDNIHSLSPEEKKTISDKCPGVKHQNEASKEKIRIDEMLLRREARDLSKAFTINDRFRFQLHIFDGDKTTFNSTIGAISAMNDLDSAMTYLSGLVDIDSEDQDMVDFITIIKNHFDIE